VQAQLELRRNLKRLGQSLAARDRAEAEKEHTLQELRQHWRTSDLRGTAARLSVLQKDTGSKGPLAALRVLRENALGSEGRFTEFALMFQGDLSVSAARYLEL